MTSKFKIKTTNKTELIFIDNLLDINSLINDKNKFIIIDSKVYELYDEFIKSLDKIVSIYKVSAEESNKSFESYYNIIKELLNLNVTSSTSIIAIGGGITTDLAGFVASTYKRGIELINVPTTLIGQIDASIGSKNGINFDNLKNVVGSYYEPSKIIICSEFLKTLDTIEVISGKIEMIKIALMFNKNYLEFISDQLDAKVLSKFSLLKMKVIKKDRNCKNIRHFLNFGHTLGHAIEILLDVPHGIAVGIGMLLIINNHQDRMLLTSAFSTINFDYKLYLEKLKTLNKNEIIKLLKNDKKNSDDFITIVTMKQPGRGQLEKVSCQELTNRIFK